MKNPLRARIGLLPVLLALLVSACGDGPPAETTAPSAIPAQVDYNFHVKPILSDRCFACHGPDDKARKAGLRLDTEEGALAKLESGNRAIVPGKPGRSELVRRITTRDPEAMMPPPESHLTLTEREIAILRRWVEQGAEYKQHWSFIPPAMPELPQVQDTKWARNEIDRFVLARLEEEGMRPSPEAAKETLIRRATFDLTGLPPTPAEIDAFLADRSPNAYEKVVDRLLGSPAYGERMAIEWLDVARYADSHGYQDDGMRAMWPWRDWVIKSFNQNRPFDEFITLQMAGDLLPQPTQEQLLATAFNRNHMQSQEGGIVPEEYRVEYVADRVNTLGKAFLGLTVECARCHDHKYDPILQKEFFQLFAFFNNVNETGQIPYSGVPSPTVILKDEAAEAKLAPIQAEISALEPQVSVWNASYDAGYEAWLDQLQKAGKSVPVEPRGLIGHFPLDEIQDNTVENLAPRGKPGALSGDVDRRPETLPGKFGNAQRLVGDSYFDFGPGFAFFERNQPFSFSIWFNVDKKGTEGPLVARTAGLFNGHRGYMVYLQKDGTLSAGLNHVMPDNSITVETLHPVRAGTWHHLVFAYDGSSRAAGIRLFLDGRLLGTQTTADNLKRSILHSGDGTNWGDGNLRIGKREEALQDVLVDDFRVYDRQLTHVEAAKLSGMPDPIGKILAEPAATRSRVQQAALREYYVLRVDPRFAPALAKLTAVRGRENDLLSSLLEVMVMKDRRQLRPTFLLARGAYDAPTERVEVGTPASVGTYPENLPKNRLGLAQWLLSDENPLTARVLVNRYWQMFFGRGIVGTPDDFGNQGELPTHPQLLDYLAISFRESGWNLKALQKKILLSATYRQSSIVDEEALNADPDNRLLARGPSYRFAAEMIRDNALAASGLLVRQIGGPSVYPYQPPGLWEELATRNATTYVQGSGDDLYRRSLYTIWKRTTPPPSMISFDAAEKLFCTVKRQRTSTPLQSLILMNDPQYVEASRLLAERIQKEGGASADERITYAFRLLTSRRPTPKELAILKGLYEAELERFRNERPAALKLLAAGEFKRDAGLDPAETAALTVVASTIMNFDEAVMKR